MGNQLNYNTVESSSDPVLLFHGKSPYKEKENCYENSSRKNEKISESDII